MQHDNTVVIRRTAGAFEIGNGLVRLMTKTCCGCPYRGLTTSLHVKVRMASAEREQRYRVRMGRHLKNVEKLGAAIYAVEDSVEFPVADDSDAPEGCAALDDVDPSSFFSDSGIGFLNSYLVEDVSRQSPEADVLALRIDTGMRPGRPTALLTEPVLDCDNVRRAALMRLLVGGAFESSASSGWTT